MQFTGPLGKETKWKYIFCVDLTELNNITELKPFAIPMIEKVLYQLQNTTVFKLLDLWSSYSQLPTKWSDKNEAAFTVRG